MFARLLLLLVTLATAGCTEYAANPGVRILVLVFIPTALLIGLFWGLARRGRGRSRGKGRNSPDPE